MTTVHQPGSVKQLLTWHENGLERGNRPNWTLDEPELAG